MHTTRSTPAAIKLGRRQDPLESESMGQSVTWLNHYSIQRADWAAIGAMDAVGVDGTFLQLLLRLQGISVERSSADISLRKPVNTWIQAGEKVAFIGGAPGVAELAASRFRAGIFTRNGFDQITDLDVLIEDLRDEGVSRVVLGLGTPRQDIVAVNIRGAIPKIAVYTAGGWLDQLAAKETYIPAIVHKWRMAWMIRVLREPVRLLPRYTLYGVLAAVRARSFVKEINKAGFRTRGRARSGRFLVKETVEPRIVQVVTQLERAGAQTLAHWVQSAMPQGSVKTAFLYNKSGSDLFDNDDAILQKRDFRIRSLIRLGVILRTLAKDSDIVVAHTHYAILAMRLAMLTIPRSRRARLVTVHHWPLEKYPGIVKMLLRAIGDHLRMDEVFVSQAIAGDAKQPTIINNPVPAARRHKSERGVDVDIMIVARHSYEKGLDVAIRAAALLDESRTINFYGEGPLTRDLHGLADKLDAGTRVVFHGARPHEEVRATMARANCVVLPSRWEAMPMVLLEAIAEDACLVVSDIDAHKFLISEGAALAFKLNDPSSLAETLRKLDKPLVRKGLSEGRDRIRLSQSEEIITGQWRKLLSPQGGVNA